MLNLFKRKKSKLPAKIIQSCEDKNVFYVELPDGLRHIFRDGEYVGHYKA